MWYFVQSCSKAINMQSKIMGFCAGNQEQKTAHVFHVLASFKQVNHYVTFVPAG